MFKAIGIASSPRRKGNSTTIIKVVLEGAASAGARTDIIHLNDLTYRGCQDCEVCGAQGKCNIRDSLTPVFSALKLADIWVLGSPIYYDGLCGQMKTFFDRCRYMTRNLDNQLQPQLAGKRAAAVIVTYEDKQRQDYRKVAEVVAAYLKWMGDFEPIEILSLSQLGPADEAAKRDDLLAQAHQAGRQLVDQLTERI